MGSPTVGYFLQEQGGKPSSCGYSPGHGFISASYARCLFWPSGRHPTCVACRRYRFPLQDLDEGETSAGIECRGTPCISSAAFPPLARKENTSTSSASTTS